MGSGPALGRTSSDGTAHSRSGGRAARRGSPAHNPTAVAPRSPECGGIVSGESVATGQYPFDTSGIEVGVDGIRRYVGLPRNVVAMLRGTVARYPERTAIVELGGPSVTYAELWDRALPVAGGLRAAGVAPGDRVALQLGNGLDWALAFWGTHLAGGVVVPLNVRLSDVEVDFILGDCAAAYVVRPGSPLPSASPVSPADAAHGEVAALFYTSGTTGRPKGAMVTHENFLSSVESVIRCRELR